MLEEDLRRIVALRFIVARAASSDSLHWWDDASLSEAGLALAGRLFARQPAVAARRLALRAARARHSAALNHLGSVLHLFDLGAEFELGFDESYGMIDLEAPTAINSLDGLRHQLAAWGIEDEPVIQRRTGAALEVECPTEASPMEQASVLAAGYLYGGVGEPVFPYLRTAGASA